MIPCIEEPIERVTERAKETIQSIKAQNDDIFSVMVDSSHPNTSLITTKQADQLITITTQAGNNLIIQWFHGLQLGRIERLVGQLGNEVGNNL